LLLYSAAKILIFVKQAVENHANGRSESVVYDKQHDENDHYDPKQAQKNLHEFKNKPKCQDTGEKERNRVFQNVVHCLISGWLF
jgi:hypothetical protein